MLLSEPRISSITGIAGRAPLVPTSGSSSLPRALGFWRAKEPLRPGAERERSSLEVGQRSAGDYDAVRDAAYQSSTHAMPETPHSSDRTRPFDAEIDRLSLEVGQRSGDYDAVRDAAYQSRTRNMPETPHRSDRMRPFDISAFKPSVMSEADISALIAEFGRRPFSLAGTTPLKLDHARIAEANDSVRRLGIKAAIASWSSTEGNAEEVDSRRDR